MSKRALVLCLLVSSMVVLLLTLGAAGTLASPADMPQAEASVFHDRLINVGPSVDFLGATTPMDARGWYDIRINNTGAVPVPQPSISVDGATTTFSPPYLGGFPVSVTNSGDLAPGGELDLNTFAGFNPDDPTTYGEDLTGVEMGADVSRSSTMSSDGTVLTETVSVTLTNPSLGGVQIEVDPGQTSQATLDTADVTLPDLSNGECPFDAGGVPPGGYKFATNCAVVGKTYILSIPIDLNGIPAASYKPNVNVEVGPDGPGSSVTANSVTVYDAALGGNVTFLAANGAQVLWGAGDQEDTNVDFPAVVPATPQAPTSVSATAGNAQATVSFAAPADDGSPITGYTVTASPGGETASGSASPITVGGLTNGTTYTFTVTATNAVGTSAASAPSNPVTPHAPLPTSKDQCMKGGWQTFGVFKNQGDCVSFVATGGDLGYARPPAGGSYVSLVRCAAGGGSVTVPAGTPFTVYGGWLADSIGLVIETVHGSTDTLTVNGGTPIDMTPYFAGLTSVWSLGSWSDIFFYQVTTLAAGQSVQVAWFAASNHPVADSGGGANGKGAGTYAYTFTCTVTGG